MYFYQNKVDHYSFPSQTKYTSTSRVSTYCTPSMKKKRIQRRKLIFDKSHKKDYKIVESRSINGFQKIYRYYIDGVRCDAMGRIATDPGFSGINDRSLALFNNENMVYPKSKSKKSKNWKKSGISGLDSGTNLQIIKNNNQFLFVLELLSHREKVLKKIKTIITNIINKNINLDFFLETSNKENLQSIAYDKLKKFQYYDNSLLLYILYLTYLGVNTSKIVNQILLIMTDNLYFNKNIKKLMIYPPQLYNNILPYNNQAPPYYFTRATLNYKNSNNNTPFMFYTDPKFYRKLKISDQSHSKYVQQKTRILTSYGDRISVVSDKNIVVTDESIVTDSKTIAGSIMNAHSTSYSSSFPIHIPSFIKNKYTSNDLIKLKKSLISSSDSLHLIPIIDSFRLGNFDTNTTNTPILHELLNKFKQHI